MARATAAPPSSPHAGADSPTYARDAEASPPPKPSDNTDRQARHEQCRQEGVQVRELPSPEGSLHPPTQRRPHHGAQAEHGVEQPVSASAPALGSLSDLTRRGREDQAVARPEDRAGHHQQGK